MFQGVVGVRQALDDVYGPGEVTIVSAAFRWLSHHSLMKQQHSGMEKERERERNREKKGGKQGGREMRLIVDIIYLDGIIIGGSSLEHILSNISACEEGPLDQSRLIM